MNVVAAVGSRRALTLGAVIALIVIPSYLVFGREYVAALDEHVYVDPTLSFSTSRGQGQSGSVLQLEGVPAQALLELSSGGSRAYSPTFAYGDGVAAVVPPVLREGALIHGDAEIRVLAPRGPIWTISGKRPFRLEPTRPTGAALAVPTLFGLYVTHALVTNAEDLAATAARAGGSTAAADHAAALRERRHEIERLTQQLELVAWGNSARVTLPEMVIDEAGIRLMDQLAVSYLGSMGGREPSACVDDQGAQASAGLSADRPEAAMVAARLFASSVLDCDVDEVRDLSVRTAMWLTALAYTGSEALRTSADVLALPVLLNVVVAWWSDEAIAATYVWMSYGHSGELRAYMAERGSMRATPHDLLASAEEDGYIGEQMERLATALASENAILASLLEEDAPGQAEVAAALEQRRPTLATPPPPPVRAGFLWLGFQHCGSLTEFRLPTATELGSITVAGERYSIPLHAELDVSARAIVGNEVCALGAWVMSERDGRSLVRLRIP